MEWRIDNDYPYLNNLIELSPIFSPPYLNVIFKSQNDYPYLSSIPALNSIFTKPYPKNIFQINNDYPYLSNVDKIEPILTKKYPENVFIQKDSSYPILYGCAKFERGGNIEILTNKSPTYQDKYMFIIEDIGDRQIKVTYKLKNGQLLNKNAEIKIVAPNLTDIEDN